MPRRKPKKSQARKRLVPKVDLRTWGDGYIRRLRAQQARRVMPLIGPLIDAWDGMPNDMRSDLEHEFPAFVEYLDEIATQMET